MPQPAEIQPVEICPAEGTEALALARALFEEYWNSFGFTPCFQNFSSELAGLPGAYAPPDGRLAIAFENGAAAGCVALRRFDATRAEAKRLYVRPQFRGRGIGRALLDWVIAEARSASYAELIGDSMLVMREAWQCTSALGLSSRGLTAAMGRST